MKMKMKTDNNQTFFKLSFLSVLILTLATFANAQTLDNPDEDDLLNQLSTEQLQILNNQPTPGTSGFVILSQSGNNNGSTVYQKNTGLQTNQAVIIQEGNNNQADLKQDGSGNSSNVIQNGNNNTYNLDLVGDDIKTTTHQNGNRNSITQDLSGSDLDYILIQNGNNNEIIQLENSNDTQMPAYQLEQSGNNMRIEIKQGKILQ